MKVQIMSDLHLEHYLSSTLSNIGNMKMPEIPVESDTLFLAGDIGSCLDSRNTLKTFFDIISSQFKTIFYIPGNHEYYGSTITEGDHILQELCNQYPNIHFMQKKTKVHENVKIIGCTLWSFIPEESYEVSNEMGDYKYIKDENGNKISVQYINQIHEDQVQWLESEVNIARESGEKVIVMTHFPPLYKGISDFPISNRSCYYGTDLERLLGPPVVAWICGHTHWSFDFVKNQTRILSNQRGYAKEGPKITDFKDNGVKKVFEITIE